MSPKPAPPTPEAFPELPRMLFRHAADAALKEAGLTRFGGWRLMVRVHATLLAWGLAYALYLGGTARLPAAALPLGLLLGVVTAGLGLIIMHDASHCTLVRSQHINRFYLMLSTHLLGISPHNWVRKHVVAHHGHTNILGQDFDLNAAGLLRLHPDVPWKPLFKWQPFYYPLAYGLVAAKWVWWGDLYEWATNLYRYSPRPRRVALLGLITSRLCHVALYIALPVHLLGWGPAALGYVGMVLAAGTVLAFVFQPAHVTPVQAFLPPGSALPTAGFEVHQIAATANFGMDHRLLTLLIGGLNYHIEHHLFPHIAHIHYPRLAPLVQALCAAHGLPYHAYPGFGAALRAHHRQMVALAEM